VEPCQAKPSQAEPVRKTSGGKPPASVNDGTNLFADEFEKQIKPRYPKRSGDQRWVKALAGFTAARKSGETLEAIVAGVERYAAWCAARQLVGTELVKQAATFFGREWCWSESWEVRNGGNGGGDGRGSEDGKPSEKWQRERERAAAGRRRLGLDSGEADGKALSPVREEA
jgi:hypothetical protein